ncbi:MAG: hypothetical protein KC434_00660 [Anaerolineales bacterium]|nr:hypothetical protein [Anaerolineales bacterium]
MSFPLIRTKLRHPPTRSQLVPRLRLQQQIQQGVHLPLTLVTAPAGFGKTTLVASAVGLSRLPVAWLSLDDADNQNGRFLHYLLAALQTVDQAVGHEAMQMLTASAQVPVELVVTSLVNDLDGSGKQLCLVLDDYHCIHNPAVHTAVNFLLEHSPDSFHLLIASRSDPPLPLARLRARGQMVELRAADLGFTKAEAAHFLNKIMGLNLDGDSVAQLAARTEGWIAGLQMAALSMRGRDDTAAFLNAFSGTNHHILDYLLEEVLTRQTEIAQTFLLQTAFLKQLTAPLCNAVTQTTDSQAMLETLERQNLFVLSLDDERKWYRYHHLFADLLQARLQQLYSDQLPQLFTRAAVWCEGNEQPSEAISYALKGENFALAGKMIARHWGATSSEGAIETVYNWLNALPKTMVQKSAPLSTAMGWMQWFTGQTEAIEPHLLAAEQALAQSEEAPANVGLPAQLAALRALVARMQNEFDVAIALGHEALDLLPPQMTVTEESQLRSMIFLALAAAYAGIGDLEKAVNAYTETIAWSRVSRNVAGVTGITYRLAGALRVLGRLREAEEACRRAMAFVQAEGIAQLPAVGILHLALSELLVEQNKLEEAAYHLAQGHALGRWSGRLDAARNAVFAQARLLLAGNDLAGALTAVQEAEQSLGERPSPLALSEIMALKAKLLLWQGELDAAARCAEKAVQLAGYDQGQTGQTAALAAWHVRVAIPDSADVLADLAVALEVAEANGRFGVALELYILRSLWHLQHGNSSKAVSDLTAALTLAEPQGFTRIFLEEGAPMQQLLSRWVAQNTGHPLNDAALHLLRQFAVAAVSPESAADSPATNLVEPLSERELDVLQIMALGKTNKEIAAQLIIARGTVKAHTASIYRKLDVTNRTEAVARARELGLLS